MARFAITTIIACASFILSFETTTAAAGEHPDKTEQSGSTRITVESYMDALETVDVRVAGMKLPFIFDTAGGVTVLTPDVADGLGLERFGRLTAFRMSGERVDLERCGETPIVMGSLELSVEPVVMDLMSLLPEGWPELGGLVSLHTLQNHIVTLDLGRSQVVLESGNTLGERVSKMTPVPARFARQAAGAALDLFLEVDSPGGNLWLEVDSGNSNTVLLAPHALKQLGIDEPGGPGTWEGRCTLNIGGECELEVDAASSDLIYDGVLDLETLKQLVITVDIPRERVWLARR